MWKWLACLTIVASLAGAGCAGQGPLADSGFGAPFQPPPPPQPYVPPPQPAQQYIYPQRGQSPQQEQLDKGQCYSWAVQQTGFDPANPQVATGPPPMQQTPQGGLFAGAFGGAALGAVGGAIGGDAGRGAAIGAGVGALFGGMRRMRWAEEQQQQQQSYMAQQQGAMNQGRGNYERAFGACMAGRGYMVR